MNAQDIAKKLSERVSPSGNGLPPIHSRFGLRSGILSCGPGSGLQGRFIGMQAEGIAGAWPAGRACSCLDHDVNLVVNLLWKSIFKVTEHSVSILALTIALVYVNKHTHHIKVPSILVFVSLFIAMLGIIHGRHRNIMDVAERKRDWRLAWMALSTMQIRDARKGRLELEHLDQNVHRFAEAALVYRSRGFHNWFVNLVASMAMSEMAFCCKCILAFYGPSNGFSYMAQLQC